MKPDDWIRVAPEIASALAARKPVVALETTLVTHGFPHPQGVAIARALEDAVRAAGALPASIGVLSGTAHVGLTDAELERLAEQRATKLNLSNLAAQLASGGDGSTTVAATLLLAHRAGIQVFATGGIGGVHRGAVETGDVSGDLRALARFPIAVVCAGAKAVLDLRKTVEALETVGVPVLGYGTDSFPAFYLRDSGFPVDHRFDDVASLARAVRAHLDISGTGVIVGNPVPKEHELASDLCDAALEQALSEAERSGFAGRDVTPFLLERLRVLTEGRSVATNLALLLNNARLAGQLALVLATV